MNFRKNVLLALVAIIIIPIIHAQNVFAVDLKCKGVLTDSKKVPDIIDKKFYQDKFVIYGDIKEYNSTTKTATNNHVSDAIQLVELSDFGYNNQPSESTELKSSDAKCEYFSELIVAGDEKDNSCDVTNGKCDYFKCSINKSLKDKYIKISVRLDIKEIECTIINETQCTQCFGLKVPNYLPEDAINLNCSEFNDCINENDSDEDGILDNVDNCVEIANPDQKDTDGDSVGDACETGECSQSVLSDIKATPVKDDSVGFKIDLSLPSGSSISDVSAIIIKEERPVSLTCSNSTKVSATKSTDSVVNLWGGTTTESDGAESAVYSCVAKDVKGDEILSLSFGYKDSEGNECSVGGGSGLSADLSKSITNNNGVIEPEGSDCSLNPNASVNGLSWLIDLFVLGLPLGLMGIRRKK